VNTLPWGTGREAASGEIGFHHKPYQTPLSGEQVSPDYFPRDGLAVVLARGLDGLMNPVTFVARVGDDPRNVSGQGPGAIEKAVPFRGRRNDWRTVDRRDRRGRLTTAKECSAFSLGHSVVLQFRRAISSRTICRNDVALQLPPTILKQEACLGMWLPV